MREDSVFSSHCDMTVARSGHISQMMRRQGVQAGKIGRQNSREWERDSEGPSVYSR